MRLENRIRILEQFARRPEVVVQILTQGLKLRGETSVDKENIIAQLYSAHTKYSCNMIIADSALLWGFAARRSAQ